MDIVKKNLVSIICGVIALVAIVAVFYPIGGMYQELQEKVTARAALQPQLDKLLNEKRTIPTLSPNPEDAKPLNVFPTKSVINYAQQITARWSTDSQNFFNQAASMNQLVPLVPETLPVVQAQTLAVGFREAYRVRFGRDLKPEDPRDRDKSIAVTVLGGGLPPTAAEIAQRQADVKRQVESKFLIYQGNKPTNAPAVQQMVAEKTATIAQELRENAARTFKIYAGRDAYEPSAAITIDTFPSAEDIFVAQVGLWVQEEFSKAIADTNARAKATSVLDAPIKRLIRLGSLRHPYGSGGSAATAGNPMLPTPAADAAAPVAAVLPIDETAALPTSYDVTPTGHTSNPMYDVVSFEVTLVVDAAALPQVLNDLSAKRFITIRNVDMMALNSNVERAGGFIYGAASVVQVRLECEYMLFRKWLGPLMPASVVAHLAAPPTGSAAGQ